MPRVFQRHKYQFLLVAIILTAASFVFRNPRVLDGVKWFTIKAVTLPVLLVQNTVHYFESKNKLYEENMSLKRELNDISFDLNRAADIRLENDRLRDLVGFREQLDYVTVPAQVIAREPSDWTGIFLINKGTADGVMKNTPVCSVKGLVGKVVDIDKNMGQVLPVTHFNFKAGAVILESRVNGVVVGAGRNKLKMLYIPIDSTVKVGSLVITSGLSRVFPKGIPIGEVTFVDRSETGLFKYAMIKPFADILKDEELLCIVDTVDIGFEGADELG